MFIINPYAFGGAPTQSILLDATSDYLSLSDGAWGSYDHEKFAIAFSILPTDAGGSEQEIITKGAISAGAGDPSSEFSVIYAPADDAVDILFEQASGNAARFRTNNGAVTTISGAFYSFLVWYDSANVTSSERIRVWINGTEISASSYTAPTAAATDNANAVRVGLADGGTTGFRGNVWSFGFFDGVLPAAADVFDGTAGAFKSFSGISGLKSYLAIEGGDVTYDSGLATNWTNNNVTAASTRP